MDYSYMGSGKVSMREVGSAAPLREVGNCSALTLNVSENSIKLADHTQPGGGTYNEVRRIESVEAALTMHDLSPENLALALYGSVSQISTTPVVAEALGAGYKGGLMKFAKPPSSAVAPVIEAAATTSARSNADPVTLNEYLVPAAPNGFYYKVTTAGTTDAAPPTFPTTAGLTVTDGTAVLTCMGRLILTVGTDYDVTGSGVRIVSGTTGFTDGELLKAGYTPAAGSKIEAMTVAGKEYELVFEGLNEARSGKPVNVHAYRVKFGAAAALDLITDEHAELAITGEVLKDTSKSGGGISQYAKIDLVS